MAKQKQTLNDENITYFLPEDVEKDGEADVQKVHDKFIKKVEEMLAAKEKEIMTV